MATRETFTVGQILTAAECSALATAMVALNAQTGASYTAALSDDGKLVTMSNGSGNTFTIPPNGTVAFGIGTQINVMQLGNGQTTIAPGAGVTLRSSGNKLKTHSQYAVVTCCKIDTDTWVVIGNLAA
jgi:hypothetical protein